MMKPQLVLCNGAEFPQNSQSEEWGKVIELDILNPYYPLFPDAQNNLAQKLPDRFLDLLEIAAFVYNAECKSTKYNKRNFHFIIPVRVPDFWKRQDVYDSLVNSLNFLSSDTFKFEFSQLTEERGSVAYFNIDNKDLTQFKGIDRVTMFSGGIDSLAGAVETAAAGKPQILVTHRITSYENKRPSDLYGHLSSTFNSPMVHIPTSINKIGRSSESNLRSHTFLLTALGAAVASMLDVGGIRLFSNGVTALNWQPQDEISQSIMSRATNPETLNRLQTFLRLVFENNDFIIDNPYIYKTKTDVVKVISEYGVQELIKDSSSCTDTKTQRDCGICEHCVNRRMAILAAGLGEFDSKNDYVSDIFEVPDPDSPINPKDHRVAVKYARFASDFSRMSDQQIKDTYGHDLVLAADSFSNAKEIFMAFIEMHKRHAAAVLEVLRNQINIHYQELIHSDPDEFCFSKIVLLGRYFGPDPNSTTPTNTHDSQSCVFKKEGEFWSIWYKGQHTNLKDSAGLFYISCLLEKPFQNWHVRVLYHTLNPPPQDPGDAKSSDIGFEESKSMVTDDFRSDSDIKDDTKLYKHYENRLIELQNDIDKYTRWRDLDNVAQLKIEKDYTEKLKNKEFGLNKEPRKPDDKNKDAYDSVSKAIKSARKRIDENISTLETHLKNTLKYNIYQYFYTPDPLLHWET